MVRWNIDALNALINRLRTEKNNLSEQHRQMEIQQNRINLNWQSPAGRMYQNRLQEDIASLSIILTLLEIRENSLRRATNYYSTAESNIQAAIARLP